EALRDSLLVAADTLDRKQGGPSVGDMLTPRRTLYLTTTMRTSRATYQKLFDSATPGEISEKRTDSVVAPQALWMMNSSFVLNQAETLAKRLETEAPSGNEERIRWL